LFLDNISASPAVCIRFPLSPRQQRQLQAALEDELSRLVTENGATSPLPIGGCYSWFADKFEQYF
jgi:hypothetical protein